MEVGKNHNNSKIVLEEINESNDNKIYERAKKLCSDNEMNLGENPITTDNSESFKLLITSLANEHFNCMNKTGDHAPKNKAEENHDNIPVDRGGSAPQPNSQSHYEQFNEKYLNTTSLCYFVMGAASVALVVYGLSRLSADAVKNIANVSGNNINR